MYMAIHKPVPQSHYNLSIPSCKMPEKLFTPCIHLLHVIYFSCPLSSSPLPLAGHGHGQEGQAARGLQTKG